MRILNPKGREPPRGRVPSEPQLYSFQVRGVRFLYDTQSMALATCEGEGEPAGTGELGVHWRPVFPPTCFTTVRYLVLNITHACNLRCHYCQAGAYSPDRHTMAPSTAIRALEQCWPAGARAPFRVGFFGGEPTLAWPILREVVQYVRGRAFPSTPSFSITTNGVTIDSAKAAFLAEHQFHITFSLDGPAKVHDQHRRTVSGEPSFGLAMAGLEHLRQAGLGKRLTLRGTYTPNTAPHLLESVQFLNRLMYEGYASHVSVEPAFLSESLCLRAADKHFSVEASATMEGAYQSVADWFIAEVEAGREPALHHFTAPLRRILWRQYAVTDCGAGMGYLTCSVDGSLYACHREAASKLGSIYEGLDEERRAPWVDNRLYGRPSCARCPIRFVCGGGCRERSLSEGDIRVPVASDCALHHVFFRAAAWILHRCSADALASFIHPKTPPPPTGFLPVAGKPTLVPGPVAGAQAGSAPAEEGP